MYEEKNGPLIFLGIFFTLASSFLNTLLDQPDETYQTHKPGFWAMWNMQGMQDIEDSDYMQDILVFGFVGYCGLDKWQHAPEHQDMKSH